MNLPDDPDELRKLLVEAWHQYGETYSVFSLEDQPAPDIWDPVLPGQDEKGKFHPDTLKHWRNLFRTKAFLRERYSKHGTLEGPSLIFDCLVPHFQERITTKWAQDEQGQPTAFEVNDNYAWYADAVRMGVFQWQVGFSCRSSLCERNWCKLHRRNPDRISPCDIYSLVSIFEGCMPNQALSAVAKWFKVKLAPLKSRGITEKTKSSRYAVSKQDIYDLFSKYKNFRHQHVNSFVQEARALIENSPYVPWHPRLFDKDKTFLSRKLIRNIYLIKGPAIKAYLWLLVKQEETARNTNAQFSISDAEMASGIGVSKRTACTYRELLSSLKLVDVRVFKGAKTEEKHIKKVKY